MTHLQLKHPQLRGTLFVAISGMLFGLMGFLGTKLFYLHFSVSNMLFWRFLVATLWIIASFVLANNKSKTPINDSKAIFRVFVLGALSYSGGSAFYFMASTHIGTGLAMVIFFSFPVFVALFALLAGTWKINKIALAALLTVITGLVFLKGSGGNTLDIAGIALALIAACCFAAYVYGSQHTTKNMDSRLLTLMVCLGNTFIFLFISLYTQTFVFPRTLDAWFYILAIGVIATALPIQFLLNGLKYISPVKASILSALEPVVTVIVGLTLLHESVSSMQALGVMMVVLGAILIQFEREHQPLTDKGM